jgi:hypothetical protein
VGTAIGELLSGGSMVVPSIGGPLDSDCVLFLPPVLVVFVVVVFVVVVFLMMVVFVMVIVWLDVELLVDVVDDELVTVVVFDVLDD